MCCWIYCTIDFSENPLKGTIKNQNFYYVKKIKQERGKVSKSGKGQNRKRGISNKQVCVLCAMDRVRNIMTEPICKGRMKHTDI